MSNKSIPCRSGVGRLVESDIGRPLLSIGELEIGRVDPVQMLPEPILAVWGPVTDVQSQVLP